jgi:hypothetical protein
MGWLKCRLLARRRRRVRYVGSRNQSGHREDAGKIDANDPTPTRPNDCVDLRDAILVGLFLDCGHGFFESLFVIARKPFDAVGPHPQN